jgi:hypothetical protein
MKLGHHRSLMKKHRDRIELFAFREIHRDVSSKKIVVSKATKQNCCLKATNTISSVD